MHRGEHLAHAEEHLNALVRDLIAEAAQAGGVRDDVAPGELATYCLHAMGAAGSLSSKAAVRRLVAVTLAGLRPSPPVPDASGAGRSPRRVAAAGGSSSAPEHGPWRHTAHARPSTDT